MNDLRYIRDLTVLHHLDTWMSLDQIWDRIGRRESGITVLALEVRLTVLVDRGLVARRERRGRPEWALTVAGLVYRAGSGDRGGDGAGGSEGGDGLVDAVAAVGKDGAHLGG